MATVVRASDRRVVARNVAVADTEVARTIGLLDKSHLDVDDGMWFARCSFIHTFGMRASIDVVFLDAGSRIVRIVECARPWRVYRGGGASHTVELAAGTARRAGLAPGDVLAIETLATA